MCYMESEEACLMSNMAAEEELLVAAMDPFILEDGEFSLHHHQQQQQQQQPGAAAADDDSGFLFQQDANNGFDSFQSPLDTLDELIRSGSVVPKVEDSAATTATTTATTFIPPCDSIIILPHRSTAAGASASPASSSSNTAAGFIFSDDATSATSVLAPPAPTAGTAAAMGIHHYDVPAAPLAPQPSSKQEQCSTNPTATSCSMASMRESLYQMAIWRPVPSPLDATLLAAKPKRRNVRISKDPQTVAARHRRERISTKIRILQRLVPGGTKMDTASMLDEAIHYVKYLKSQVQAMELLEQNGSVDRATFAASSGLCQLYNQQQQLQLPSAGNLGGLAAVSSAPTGGSTFFWPPQQHFNPVLGYQQLGY